jgi:hypothetical protein
MFVGAACYLIWAVNESRLHRRHAAESGVAPVAGPSDLKAVVAQMQQASAAQQKLAA